MVARILAECGVYLGEPNQLVPATAANQAGHFEHMDFLHVNRTVLRKLRGSWETPPHPLAWRILGWRLRSPRELARELIQTMAQHRPWAWKDPRTSLTLRFWLPLLPDLRIVVCVREPLAVARSLEARDGREIRSGLELWRNYYAALFRDAAPSLVLVTSYERYFDRPEVEIGRLITRLDLRAGRAQIAAAAATVRPELRRQSPAEIGPLSDSVARWRADLLELARR